MAKEFENLAFVAKMTVNIYSNLVLLKEIEAHEKNYLCRAVD